MDKNMGKYIQLQICKSNLDTIYMVVYGWYTIPVGQGRRKIILKINAKILGTLFFQKIFFLYGENKNLPE
jgi:hypothetical protein